MRVTRLILRDFRSHERVDMALGAGTTVILGRNGAGKTNLLEGLFLGCTGRSFRTSSEREAVRFAAPLARVAVHSEAEDGPHEVTIGLARTGPRQVRVDGRPVEAMTDARRPLASVFAPDRLELVKGGPALRRGHLDQVVAALWPARAENRRAYGRALGQRNALLARLRTTDRGAEALAAWDAQLAERAMTLMGDRRQAVERLAPPFAAMADVLGLEGDAGLAYWPRSRAESAPELVRELAERLGTDRERGFTGHGPHRDDLALTHDGRELRTYGSQGQQRLGLLALLMAEREVIAQLRGAPPLMLLDDVMSELDAERRGRLVRVLAQQGGQSVITTTDLDHVPGARDPVVVRVTVGPGAVLEMATEEAAA